MGTILEQAGQDFVILPKFIPKYLQTSGLRGQKKPGVLRYKTPGAYSFRQKIPENLLFIAIVMEYWQEMHHHRRLQP